VKIFTKSLPRLEPRVNSKYRDAASPVKGSV